MSRYLFLVSFTILLYNFFLTLSVEIQCFWRRRMSFVSILFLCNRYLTMIGGIPRALEAFKYFTEERCRLLRSFDYSFLLLSQSAVTLLLGVRTFALYERSKMILVLLVIIYTIVITVAGWAILTVHESSDSDVIGIIVWPDCNIALTLQQSYRFVGAWGAELLCDVVVFVLTLRKLTSVARVWTGSLSEIMLWDG